VGAKLVVMRQQGQGLPDAVAKNVFGICPADRPSGIEE